MELDHLLVFRVITVRLLPMVRKGWHCAQRGDEIHAARLLYCSG